MGRDGTGTGQEPRILESVISFFSDLGPGSEGVGVVHAVVARIAPDERVVDVSHLLPRGDVRAAALALTRSVQYLPAGVVLASLLAPPFSRVRSIAAQTPIGVVIGPDNGLLSPAVAMVGGASEIFEVSNPEFAIPSAGTPQRLRDVLAPAAAVVASGQALLADLGDPVDPGSVQPLLLPLPEVGEGRVVGEAWWKNPAGHLQTNLGPEDVAMAGFRPGVGGALSVGSTEYSICWIDGDDPGEAEAFFYIDDFGLVTVGATGESAETALRLSPGTALTLRVAEPRTTSR